MDDTNVQPEVRPLSPHLIVAGAAKAIEFYENAFGAVELMRMPGENDTIMHACVWINGGSVMLVDENTEHGLLGPIALGGTPVTLHLLVDDADSWFERAVAAGANGLMPPADMFWGDRYGMVADPFGHRWALASSKGMTMTVDEMIEAARAAGQGPSA